MPQSLSPAPHVRGRVEAILRDHAPPSGLAAAVASGQSAAHHFHAGLADIAQALPIDDSHLFGIGSVTKVFVAVVILQLVEEGVLQLSDTVGQYLPPGIVHDIVNATTATIAQLLNHTSGVESWEDDPDWIAHGRGRSVRPTHIWSKTEPLDYIRRPPRVPLSVGEWHYSNTNYTILGLIIEKVTQRTAESEIRRRILDTLQLHETYLEGFEEGSVARLPCRYHLATAEFRHNAGVCPAFPEVDTGCIEAKGYNMSTSWLAGGMISCPADLLRFAFALRDGKLLQPSSMTAMQQWIPAGESREMGLGLFRMELPGSGRWIGHAGGVLGFSAGLWWHEEEDCAICVLGNLGTVHAGDVTTGVKAVIMKGSFPALALQLVQSQGGTPVDGL